MTVKPCAQFAATAARDKPRCGHNRANRAVAERGCSPNIRFSSGSSAVRDTGVNALVLREVEQRQ